MSNVAGCPQTWTLRRPAAIGPPSGEWNAGPFPLEPIVASGPFDRFSFTPAVPPPSIPSVERRSMCRC